MKNILTSIALLALVSCKDDTVKPVNGTEISTEQNTDSEVITDTKPVTGEEALHDEVVVLQKNIDNATAADRKSLLDRYLTYHEKVDGAVAESYFAFAFDYEQNKAKDFYSALTDKDTAFLKQWAEAAAFEAGLGIETQSDAEAFFQDLKHTNESKAALLSDTEKQLFGLYHKTLEQNTLNAMRN